MLEEGIMNSGKIILVFFLLFFAAGCSVETKKEFYPDGKVKAEKRYKKGRLEGLAKEFYVSGKLKAKIYYKEDKPMTSTCYDEKENIIPCPQQ
jgi:antitoxin component YwqK of YwqJK toxin-antitoxin module